MDSLSDHQGQTGPAAQCTEMQSCFNVRLRKLTYIAASYHNKNYLDLMK